MNKVEELFKSTKLSEVLEKRDKEKFRKKVLIVLAVIGGVVVVAGIAYAVYRYLAPTYLNDFEDEFEDEFDEDFGVELAKARIERGQDAGKIETNDVTMITEDLIMAELLGKLSYIVSNIDSYI